MKVIPSYWARLIALSASSALTIFCNSSFAQSNQLTWTQTWTGTPLLSSIESIAYGNGVFVGVGYGVAGYGGQRILSHDGVNWTTYISPPIIDGGPIPGSTTTSNGVSTTTGAIPGKAPGIIFGDGTFYEYGGSGVDKVNYVLQSTNGLTWTPIYEFPFTYTNHIFTAAIGNSSLVLITEDDQIIAGSIATTNWNWTHLKAPFRLVSVAYGNGIFAMLASINYFDPFLFEDSAYNMVLSSRDGITWQFDSAPLGTTALFSGIAYGNGVFVATAYDADLGGIALASSNLADWVSSVLFQPTNIVFEVDGNSYSFPVKFTETTFVKNRFITLANFIFGTFASLDGINWTTNSWPSDVSTFTFGQRTFLAAGQNIYQSEMVTNDLPEPTILGISSYPGMTLTGTAGTVFQIQSTTNLNAAWQPLTNLMLPYSPFIWVDTSPPINGQKFYRSIQFQ